MAAVALEEQHLRSVLAAAAECDAVQRDDGLGALLDALSGLVDADVLFWNAFRLRPFAEVALTWPRGRSEPQRAPLEGWLEHLPEHPIMSGTHGPVVSLSDVLAPRELDRTWLSQEAMRPAGVRHEIGLELSHPSDAMSVVVLSRTGGPDFDDRDHLVLALVRPHVDAAVRRLRAPDVPLTPRQRCVLRLVRDGLTNAQIAARTGMSEATVGKHLEHVYTRTGARNRAQAVALCWQALDDAG